MKPRFRFDENLRDLPEDMNAMRSYIHQLQNQLTQNLEVAKQVSLLGEMGVYSRSIGELDQSEKFLLEALQLIRDNSLGLRLEIQQKIRLANTLQWKRCFDHSNGLFDEILQTCQIKGEANYYLDFAWQHAGKNYFDQKRYQEAKGAFENALNLRKQKKASYDQIKSSELALQRTLALLNK